MENEIPNEQETKITSSYLNISLLSFISNHSTLQVEGKFSQEKIKAKDILDEMPCIHCKGVQYYDLRKINYLNNSELAELIEILKYEIKLGKEIQFVNMNEKIKNKIKSLKLEHIFNCE